MEVTIYKPDDCREKMINNLRNGQEKGSTTYIDELDQHWTWRKSEANIWTGFSGQGKSEALHFLCLIKALEENWKFTFNSPESFPAHEWLDSFIHCLSGKTTDKFNLYNELITEELYNYCLDKIKNNFNFLYIKPPHNTVENCLSEFQKIHDENPQDVFVMDPIMKFQKSKDAPNEYDGYATYVDTLITDFARRNNVSIHLVIHQVTPKIHEVTGEYAKVSEYQVKGGGSWLDGIDNMLFVQRPNIVKNRLDTLVNIGSLKIKKHKLTGIPGDIFWRFDRKTNRYTCEDGSPLYIFEKWLPNYKKKIHF